MQRNDRMRLLELLDAAKKEVSAAKVEVVHCKSNRVNGRVLSDGEYYTFSDKKVINSKV